MVKPGKCARRQGRLHTQNQRLFSLNFHARQGMAACFNSIINAMPEPKNDSRRAYANAPVNRRTAPREAPKPAPPLPDAVRARVQKTRQRQLLGVPLSELLDPRTNNAPPPPPHAQQRLHPGLIGATVLTVAAASALVLLRSGTGLALAGALAALGFACWLWQRRSQPAAQLASSAVSLPASSSPSPFDSETLRRIDEAFEATATTVNESTLAALISLKTATGRIALSLDSAQINGEFTQEDRLYVIESLRRYIPDTLNAYRQIPPAQRALPGPQAGPSANQILLSQLALLQSELEQREQRLHVGSVEALLREQRFLQAKAAGS